MDIYRIVATPLFLWFCLLLFVLGVMMFQWLPDRFELVLLDNLWQPERVRAAIADMDATQRAAHIWLTSSVDVVFPHSLWAICPWLRPAFTASSAQADHRLGNAANWL